MPSAMASSFDLTSMTPKERYDWERRSFVGFLEEDFRRLFFDKEAFLSELLAVMTGAFLTVELAESRINVLRAVYGIDEAIFDAIFMKRYGYLNSAITNDLWRCLLENRVIVRVWRPNFLRHSEYSIDVKVLAHHLDDRTFHNIFFPLAEIHKRYSAMITSIDVRTDKGDLARGSGFLVGPVFELMGPSLPRPRILVTCRHNVDAVDVEEVTTANGTSITLGQPYLSDEHDIALFSVSVFINEYPIAIRGHAEVFNDVYTIGFPQIPRADPTLLGHKGEVNGFARRYSERDRIMLISNIVSPGSSGCPVLDRFGRCVGMTINWLEGTYGENNEQSARFSAAIPIETISEELVKAGLSWWTDETSPLFG